MQTFACEHVRGYLELGRSLAVVSPRNGGVLASAVLKVSRCVLRVVVTQRWAK